MNLYDVSHANDYDLKENQVSLSSINFKNKMTNSGNSGNFNNKLLPTPISITNKSFVNNNNTNSGNIITTTATSKQNNNNLLNKSSSHQKSSGNIESTSIINNTNKPLASSSSSKPQIRGYSVDRQLTVGSEKKKK